MFANTEKAFAALPEKMKDKLRNLKVIHSAKIPYADDGFYALEKEERSMKILPSKEAKATFSHPMIKFILKPKKNAYLLILCIPSTSRVSQKTNPNSFYGSFMNT